MVFYRRWNKEVDAAAGATVDALTESISDDRNQQEMLNHLRVLGLTHPADWDEITDAYQRLVSDLTPGPGASHRRVALAKHYLDEVNHAYTSLRMLAVA